MIYKIADIIVDFKNEYPYTTKYMKDYEYHGNEIPLITASYSKDDLMAEHTASPEFGIGYIENLCLFRSFAKQIPIYNRMLIHSSVVEIDGEAYAFLGRSGIGKSTHSNLYVKYIDGASILNGDKPIYSIEKDNTYVHSTPWQGKENNGHLGKAKLKAMCFIRQAKENKITKLTKNEAWKLLFQQILILDTEEGVNKTFDLINILLDNIDFYVLDCDISENAVKTSYEALTKKAYKTKEN